MPLLSITTNQPVEAVSPDEFLKQTSKAVAEMLGKPERYVMVRLEQNPQMLFGGESSPLAYLELKSIGLPAKRTEEFSQTLCDLISRQLKIPSERIYIEFSDAERHLWGWDGRTF